MNKKDKELQSVLTFFFAVLFHSIITYCHAQDHNIEMLIKNEFQTLKGLAYLPETSLVLDYTSNKSSEEKIEKGILIFNVSQLDFITNAVGNQYKLDIIRLIIAHELGHQVQYRINGNTKGGLLYECQADILAGYLLFKAQTVESAIWQKNNANPGIQDPKYQKKLVEWNDRFSAALTAIFKEGSNHVLRPSHPTNEERRLALRDGYTFGYVWLFSGLPESDPFPLPTDSKSLEAVHNLAEKYKALLNYLPGDDPGSWSYRHANKIIHSFLPNCRDVVVYTHWTIDSSELDYKITYDQYITNTGNKTITFNYYNQVYGVKRIDPKNTLYWQLLSTKSHSITLPPRTTQFVEGNLTWLTSYEFAPDFIYPGKEGALFSCVTLTDKIEESSDMAANYFSGGKPQSDEKIMEAYLTTRDLLSTYIGAVGVTYDQASTNDISYLSRLQFSNSNETNILYNRASDEYDLESKFYKGTQNDAALQSVQKIISLLNANKYNAVKRSAMNNPQSQEWGIRNPLGKSVGKIFMIYSPSFMEYEVIFKIFGSKSTNNF